MTRLFLCKKGSRPVTAWSGGRVGDGGILHVDYQQHINQRENSTYRVFEITSEAKGENKKRGRDGKREDIGKRLYKKLDIQASCGYDYKDE
ncbi:MAG: hypothetical protein GY782_01425 [Gammaproteobacteria bacterium]|nr:hypothetical protein [Gammaproteobacteria bacterium]